MYSCTASLQSVAVRMLQQATTVQYTHRRESLRVPKLAMEHGHHPTNALNHLMEAVDLSGLAGAQQCLWPPPSSRPTSGNRPA